MSNILVTIGIAFVLIMIALAALALTWFFTGRSSIKAGSCGRAPTKKREESCGTKKTCSLCESDKKDEDDGIQQR